MSQEVYTQLNTVSIELIASLQQLHSVLKQEHQFLEEKNIEALSAVAENKKQISSNIELLEQQYIKLITQSGIEPAPQNITQFLEMASQSVPELADKWQQIEQLGKACSDQNTVNGIILEYNRRNVESRLAILHGQPLTPDAYSRNGKTTTSTHSNTLAQV